MNGDKVKAEYGTTREGGIIRKRRGGGKSLKVVKAKTENRRRKRTK